MRLFEILLGVACGAAVSGVAASRAAEPGFDLGVEFGGTYQHKNDVQIPNDSAGTRFSLEDLVGSGPWATARLNLNWNINEKHGIRVVLAPFSYSERGRLDRAVDFAGASYAPDQAVSASYRFNSWRVGYRYNFYTRNAWELWAGATLKVRDAEIKLRQNEVSSSDDDLGFVPLLYLAAQYRFNDQWLFQADFDGLAGGPGRAFDVSARLVYEAGDRWRIGLGYRGLEGGADTDDVYNFAWFNTAFLSVNYRF
jgi:opacity protein-like surface antigen